MKLPESQTPVAGLVLGQTDEKYEQRHIPMDRIKTQTLD